MTEVWKHIDGFENYLISNTGKVKSLYFNREKILKPGKTNNYDTTKRSYQFVNLYKNGKCYSITIHKLVAQSFLDNFDKENNFVIDHIDNNPYNNEITNLQLTTNRINCSKDVKNKTSKYTGVYYNSNRHKWYAQIKVNNKTLYLGSFINEDDAGNIYQQAYSKINNCTFNINDMQKSGKPQKAPKVSSPDRKHPNYMKEKDTPVRRTSPMAPMVGKKLSK